MRALTLALGVAAIAVCGCGSSGGGSGSVDQGSLEGVATAWGGAYRADGTLDSATLLAIRNPGCPRARYVRFLDAQNRSAKAAKLTPSEQRSAAKGLPSNLHPVLAFSGRTSAGNPKLVALSAVPSSARAVTVHWGPERITKSILNGNASFGTTHPFVQINGTWYDGGCPFLSQAKQRQLSLGK